MRVPIFLIALSAIYIESVRGLKCYEGFNATIMEVPFYHWEERECRSGYDCFTQEISIPLTFYQLEARIRYGGCISSGYSQLLTCQQLFGDKSNLDPVMLFNILPQLDNFTASIQQDFKDDMAGSFRTLFSNGHALKSFVDGIYKLLSILGLNTDKAILLRKPLVDLIDKSLPRYEWIHSAPQPSPPTPEEAARLVEKFYNALKNVTDIYKLEYPESAFPDIIWRFAQYIKVIVAGPKILDCYAVSQTGNYTAINKCYDDQKGAYDDYHKHLYNGVVELTVDAQFAIFKEVDFANFDLYHATLEAFPDYQFIIKLMRVIDSRDIKDLIKSLYKWYEYPPDRPYSVGFFEKLVGLTNKTISKISSKLVDLHKELRKEFSPRSCKFDSCKAELCNTHKRLTRAKEYLKLRESVRGKKEKEMSVTSTGRVSKSAKAANDAYMIPTQKAAKGTDRSDSRNNNNSTGSSSSSSGAGGRTSTTMATSASTTRSSGRLHASCLLNAIVLLLFLPKSL